MSDEDRLRVQIFANLSLALIAAAFTTLAGVVGGFALNAGKLLPGYALVVLAVVVVTCGCLIGSIYCGGRGVRATHNTIRDHQPGAAFPNNYDQGNFERQAIMGLAGLVLGVIVFILVGKGQSPTTAVMETLLSDIQHTQEKTKSLEERIGRHEGVQQQSFVQILTSSIQDIQTKLNSLEGKINHLESSIRKP
jgi:hypothetical protein